MTTKTGSQLFGLLVIAAALTLAPRPMASAQQNDGLPAPKSSERISREASGVVRVKFARGDKIEVDNRTTGPIVVIGWDRDFIEASAVSDRGVENVRVGIYPDQSGAKIFLKADYAESEEHPFLKEFEFRAFKRVDRAWVRTPRFPQENEPEVKADVPTPPVLSAPPLPIRNRQDLFPALSFRPGEIFIEVKVPRSAEIEPINVIRSDVLVSGVETAISVNGEKSSIKLVSVGGAAVKTRSGQVEVENINGLVDVITTTGAIVVKNARSDVRALSLSGRIEIQCARGRVDVSNTDGPITLKGVGGDASATTTNSPVRFTGPIKPEGRYYLKSMSGSVEMETPANSPGFTATLLSYRSEVTTDFSLKLKPSTAQTSPIRRLIGRFGNGQAQITLDSFDGAVKLIKLTAGSVNDCK